MQEITDILKRGIELHKARELDEAETIYDIALSFSPQDPRALYLMGTLYSELNRDGIATALLISAMNIQPTSEIANNLGIVLRRIGHEAAALEAYQTALQIDPENSDAMSNMSGYYVNQGDPAKGVEWAEKTLEIDPENKPAKSHKGLCLLEMGDYENGWEWYKARHELDSWHERTYAPRWDGKKVKKLIIHGEQGLGDEILFMSWWPRIKDMADEIIIEVTPRLKTLFERSFGVRCYTEQSEVPDTDIDAQVAMGDMPSFLGELPPKHDGYLKPDPERVAFYRARMAELGDGPYVGLSWKGGLKTTHTHLRNTTIEDWRQFTEIGTPISLQYGSAGKGAEVLNIAHWQDAIDDLDELAALISACDLVISVCNTTIHMAGALNVPCYVLTPSKPAWRYGLKGESMPWYGSTTMLRQEGEDWGPILKEARERLTAFVRQEAA